MTSTTIFILRHVVLQMYPAVYPSELVIYTTVDVNAIYYSKQVFVNYKHVLFAQKDLEVVNVCLVQMMLDGHKEGDPLNVI